MASFPRLGRDKSSTGSQGSLHSVSQEFSKTVFEISQRLERVDTKPWIGERLLLKVRSIEGSVIQLEVLDKENSDKLFSSKRVGISPIPSSIHSAALTGSIQSEAEMSVNSDITYGVEPPYDDDRENPNFYQLMPLKSEEYDFSLKVPKVLDLIRKGQSVIFEGSRFSGKRKAIVESIVAKTGRFRDGANQSARTLILTFERESAEYFHRKVQQKISHIREVRTSICVGSTKVRDNIRELDEGCQIVFGTPARLVDLLTREVLKLGEIKFLVIYCNRHLPAEFQEPLQNIAKHLPKNFQYLITYPLSANFDFNLLQSYTYDRFGEHKLLVDSTPHFHRLNIVGQPLYKRDVLWMVSNQQRIGIICGRNDLSMIDIWLDDFHCPVTCLIPTYKKLPSKGRERRHYIKQSKTLFKERVASYHNGILIMLQESVKFAPSSLDGSLDVLLILGSCPKLHDPDYRDHLLIKPGGHIFTNIPDLQFKNCSKTKSSAEMAIGKESSI